MNKIINIDQEIEKVIEELKKDRKWETQKWFRYTYHLEGKAHGLVNCIVLPYEDKMIQIFFVE